jgi:hypothetical protein
MIKTPKALTKNTMLSYYSLKEINQVVWAIFIFRQKMAKVIGNFQNLLSETYLK